jgi:hypothetical protein
MSTSVTKIEKDKATSSKPGAATLVQITFDLIDASATEILKIGVSGNMNQMICSIR